MKAAFLHSARDLRIENIPDPTPKPGEVLLRVKAVGICGSDLHAYLYGHIGGLRAEKPLILGHEAAGVVEAIGPDTETALKVGQVVAIDPSLPCGKCESCVKGHPNLCMQQAFLGVYPDHGALREYMAYPAHACVPIPDGVSPIAAALLEPLGVALHGIRLAKITVGDDILVTGCGAIGLLTIRLARLAGAGRIFATDFYDWRRKKALEWGATDVLDPAAVNVASEIMRLTDGRGVDIGIEAAWVNTTMNDCVAATRPGGKVIIVGIPAEDAITMSASDTRRKGLTVKISRRMKHTYPAAITLAAAQQVPLDEIGTPCFPLEQTVQAYEAAATYHPGVLRAVILPTAL